jgi:integrase
MQDPTSEKQKPTPKFYDFDEYQWLLDAAEKLDPRIHLLALLGGDAGLRRGEIIALEWPNVDLRRGRLLIDRSEWKGKTTETKGMESRSLR